MDLVKPLFEICLGVADDIISDPERRAGKGSIKGSETSETLGVIRKDIYVEYQIFHKYPHNMRRHRDPLLSLVTQ